MSSDYARLQLSFPHNHPQTLAAARTQRAALIMALPRALCTCTGSPSAPEAGARPSGPGGSPTLPQRPPPGVADEAARRRGETQGRFNSLAPAIWTVQVEGDGETAAGSQAAATGCWVTAVLRTHHLDGAGGRVDADRVPAFDVSDGPANLCRCEETTCQSETTALLDATGCRV